MIVVRVLFEVDPPSKNPLAIGDCSRWMLKVKLPFVVLSTRRTDHLGVSNHPMFHVD